MSDEITFLREELEKGITAARLQEISVDIISRFRDKNPASLSEYARINDLDTKAPAQRLFATLIQKYHPDKLTRIHKDIESFTLGGKRDALIQMKRIYLFGSIPKRTLRPVIVQEDESYEYTEDDFGYNEAVFEEKEDDDDIPDDKEDKVEETELRYFDEERNFTEAVNDYFFGNLEDTVTVSDLKNLDGDIDLSERNISILKGIEYCEYLTSLNLSGNNIDRIDRLSPLTRLTSLFISDNRIENIHVLASMKDLEELDLSNNLIEDISALCGLDRLLYVNLMNNPVQDRSIIEKLSAKGIIVLA